VQGQSEDSQPVCRCQLHILCIINPGIYLSVQSVFPNAFMIEPAPNTKKFTFFHLKADVVNSQDLPVLFG